MNVVIRDARDEDAAAGCEVMRRSITELCVADHGNDPVLLSKWLGNKTPDAFRAWIGQPGNSLLVAVETDAAGGRILAVGSVTDQGRVTLNYVAPDARFRGVSKSMLAALERRAAERGCRSCVLASTKTARRFYSTCGYLESGPPASHVGITSYPMSKALDART